MKWADLLGKRVQSPCQQRLGFGSKSDQLVRYNDDGCHNDDDCNNDKDKIGNDGCSNNNGDDDDCNDAHPGHCKGRCDKFASRSRERETDHKAEYR